MANEEQQTNVITGSVTPILHNASQTTEQQLSGEENVRSYRDVVKNASLKCDVEHPEHGVNPKETNVRQKRKKASEKLDANVTSDGKASLDDRSMGKESTVSSHPAPSSEALGNLSKANGKRLKLDLKTHQDHQTIDPTSPLGLLHEEKVIVRTKPPIPPKPDVRTIQASSQGQQRATVSPAAPQTKGKKQQVTDAHNAHTVQKLLAQNEQMRLELSELRSSLAAERNAVRVLRAQNESDLRKTKSECKKLQEALQHQKRHTQAQGPCPSVSVGGGTPAKRAHRGSSEQQEPHGGWASETRGPHHQQQCCLEVLKLNQEISALRETNKFLEEKYQISSEAERQKASDIRVQRDLHELRLTQLSKSARNEIQRMLEELKSKDRSIAQLKKELQAALAAQVGAGGGCRKERKAAKNSAQQSHEMRKLRETAEPCSGTISKSNSNNSIQSVTDDYEQLETKESLELTIVTATTTTTAVPAAEEASTHDCSCRTTRNTSETQATNIDVALETTTCGNDEAERPTLPHELCKRTEEAHSNDSSSVCSVVLAASKVSLPYFAPNATDTESAQRTIVSIECQQASLSSDPDSALSSMSPQPNSFTGDAPQDDPWNVQHSPIVREEGKLARIKVELDEMQQRYETLNRDYTLAKEQIDQLEQELVKATQASREQSKLNERIAYLVKREEDLLKESHELREQNELLEFRIIELEESHDKWSLRNNSSPTVGGGTTKDGWTDTEKEHDELIMLSERSDSGVTSPNSHHHLEDQQSGVPSPCDLSLLDQIPTDDVRKRLIAMTKRTCYDEEDKLCFLQILSLLNNLEALSQDHEIAGDDMSLEPPVQKYNYSLPDSSTPPKALLQSAAAAVMSSSTPYKAGTGRIVATVQPFHSSDQHVTTQTPSPKAPSIASIAETFGGMKKSTRWNNATSLQESGVFVDEPCTHAATQTETEDFPALEKTNAELCAEIEKLNRFREKIEECKGVAAAVCKTPSKGSMVALNLPAASGDEACDRRRLQFYVERAEMLENKLKVYESSGDQQQQHLSERLQREVQLETWVKQLSEKLGRVELENERLEEERCELEEIENDTRLRLQRLEEDLEVMGQRNEELEMSRSSYQSKFADAKENITNLEELIHKYEEKIFLLEENENELREKIELIYMFIPMLLLYNSWQLQEQFKQYHSALMAHYPLHQQKQQRSTLSYAEPHAIQCIPTEHIDYYDSSCSQADDLQSRLSELMSREKELTQNIAELNRAYNETLENADNLWAQMEREYKEKIGRCEQEEATLKSKIAQLEERLSKDSEYASERIAHLEEAEHSLKSRVSRLGKENKELSAKHGALLEEYGTLKDDYAKLQNYLRGPAAEALEREKKRVVALEDELAHTDQMLRDGEESHRTEVGTLRGRLLTSTKELNHIEVTNSELREEVETLEARIRELMSQRGSDEERIKQLTEELEAKQSQIVALQHARKTVGTGTGSNRSSVERSLAQELERPLKGTYTRHGYEVHPLGRKFPDSDSSGGEDRGKFPHTRPSVFETKEVKSLAETIILNAESRGVKTPKKSFVEEMN